MRAVLCWLLWASVVWANDIVIIGEVHDNPHHHRVQAELVEALRPAALVIEMLTEDQAAKVQPDIRADPVALESALGWNASGWPDFSMYHPIFVASPDAAIYGAAVPRVQARAARNSGIAEVFGTQAAQYGLTEPLPPDQKTEREAWQMASHCNALPEDLLPELVAMQRLRDARLAQVALQALDETGGPVVVIAGNGHARADWGIAAYLARSRPAVSVQTIGQSEDGAMPAGKFDQVIDSPIVDRPDPCAVMVR